MESENVSQTVEKLTYQAPVLSPLGSMKNFVLGPRKGGSDAGSPSITAS